jgi:1-acyl-sn-glycerol-3-phosphate acyltransferase
MASFRPFANAGHAVGWTVFLSSVALGCFSVTRSRSMFRKFTRVWAEGLAAGWGMQVRTFGGEQIAPDRPYVFIANHQSHVDIVALFVGLPMDVGFLAKKELKRVPFLGQAMVAGGHVFIDRAVRASARAAVAEAAGEVAAGSSIVVFPEGTRSREDAVQPFKKGGFHLARAAGVPIVPVGLRGTRAMMGRDDWGVRPGYVEVHIGAPVVPAEFDDVALLVAHVRDQVARLAGVPLGSESSQGHPNQG